MIIKDTTPDHVREIRFRIWDTANKRMLGPFGPFHQHGEYEILYLEGHLDVSVAGQLVFDQLTSAKDKNNNPIYEGDILKGRISTGWSHSSKHKKWYCQVKWSNWNAGWVMDGKTDQRWRFYPSWGQCEVVGNVHQNGDLLQ